MSGKRLTEGGLIDRSKSRRFTFGKKSFSGFEGDTLASALLGEDQLLIGRSFKYHRPRGLLAAGAEEPNGLVQLEEGALSEPNMRATQIQLYEDLSAAPQNAWPSIEHDTGEINNWLSKLFPSGFYYKTFMWPASFWLTYEKVIRRMAGLGRAPSGEDPQRYDHLYQHCDLLIVGGGPAGLAAALAAGRAGVDVLLVEQDFVLGGALLGESASATINGASGPAWAAKTGKALEALPNVRVLTRTSLAGYYDDNYLTAVEMLTDHLPLAERGGTARQRLHKIRATKVLIASGAIERPLTFDSNDLPGVMLASAVQTYINRYAVLPGQSIVVTTNNDSGYSLACDARKAGAEVILVDARPAPPTELARKMIALGIPIFAGSAVVEACGKKRVTGAKIAAISEDGQSLTGKPRHLSADLIAMAGGWNPAVHLHSQARGKLLWREDIAAFIPDPKSEVEDHLNAGAVNGTWSLKACLQDGFAAGNKLAEALGRTAARPRWSVKETVQELPLRAIWRIPGERGLGEGRAKQFVDFQNDVTAADIMLAEREGYVSVEHLKRYTTMGMATDQGKTSNVIALALMAQKRGISIPESGTTTFRPPYTPLCFGTISGQQRGETFIPIRTTPMHLSETAVGAEFECVGDWMRAYYYPRPGETMEQAVHRECTAVREGVGMFDASTLGKIDIQGKDAAKFLNIIYTNAWLKLGIGRCRYGLMLNEHGMVFDDGVTTRLGENHFHMTTTTGGAARVLTWMEEWLQTEWPELEVYCTTVTEEWAVIALSGPKSRELLGRMTDLDLSTEAFPFMTMQETELAGIPARIYRISFNGEIAYEINVPARYGRALWDHIAKIGEGHVTPYGTETMHVLRAEKGFIIAGQDTDGTTTPLDLGMDWIVNMKKGEFLGRRSLARSDTAKAGRKQLVGLLPERQDFVMPRGLHLLEPGTPDQAPFEHLGHVSSTYKSPNLSRAIGLGLIKNGFARKGQVLIGRTLDGRDERILVTDPVFIDPEGGRGRG